ncbi:MAG: class I SAM-dependent methyltransferase [Polyangia bacterium]
MPLDDTRRAEAEQLRGRLGSGAVPPSEFRAALLRVPPAERDAWLDRILGLDELPDDGPDLPRGCVPYIPCAVDTLLRMVEHAAVQAGDVFVDIGAGLGRSAVFTHLLTGASALGIEIQASLVRAARELAQRLNTPRVAVLEGDAAQRTDSLASGSVFFLYCPFSGARLEQVLDGLEAVARVRPIRVCCVDLALPPRPWLLAAPPARDLVVYRSTGTTQR